MSFVIHALKKSCFGIEKHVVLSPSCLSVFIYFALVVVLFSVCAEAVTGGINTAPGNAVLQDTARYTEKLRENTAERIKGKAGMPRRRKEDGQGRKEKENQNSP